MDLARRTLNLGLGVARLYVRVGFGVVRTAARIVGLDGHEAATESAGAEPVRAQPAPARPAPVRVEQPTNGRVHDDGPVTEVEVEVVVADEPEAEVEPEPAAETVVDAEPAVEPESAAETTATEPAEPIFGDEPAHIDDEPELVAEFAEPGAEEGAHAELHVQEPWSGYRRMKVADVRERIAVADAAELAVVQLYESTNRNRKSILDAVARRTRELANAPSAH